LPFDEPVSLGAVDQLHGTVVADMQQPGQCPNGWHLAMRQALDKQHQLILARFKGLVFRHPVAEFQVLMNVHAELAKGAKLRIFDLTVFPASGVLFHSA
jgi:hypothetical protein